MTATPMPVDPGILAAVAGARYHSPHSVLGAHVHDGAVTIRTVRHLADAVEVVTADGIYDAEHEQDGVWVAVLPTATIPDYRLRVTYGDQTADVDEPYRYLPTLGEMDIYLIREGRHETLWTVLGSRIREYT
ncbi:MAG: 1,4-alpha-glucan branching enzyme, partial [Actinomycetaceae bacterium]|nr:1,4-alpha-glucan branching enzyme [Actinomycetaceae bacterium]